MKTALWFIVFVIFLIVIGPILTIWSLNTLFPQLNIPYSIETWFAVVVLGAAIKARVETK